MAYQRELILERLTVISEGLGVTAARDVLNFDEAQLPAIAVVEGDEEADEDDPTNRPSTAPRRVHMIPHIIIHTGGLSQNLGPALNALYARLVKAVLTDATLLSLVWDGNGRGVRYLGMESDLALGRTMFGNIAAKFRFTYVLDPNSL